MRTAFYSEFLGTLPPSLLPLLSVVAAIFLWVAADEAKLKVREVDVQVAAASKRLSRGSAQEVVSRQAEASRLQAQRQALMQRLKSVESEQMTRAKLTFELRQKCNAVPVTCQVRLADLTSAETLKNRAAGVDADESLEGLGVSRARAVLSGTFKGDELLGLYTMFAHDPVAQWRLNALVVKGNAFEFDVERLVLRQAGSASP